MEHLNYCRQIAQLAKARAMVPSLPSDQRQEAMHIVSLCATSQKFLLPYGGRLLDDDELRALDDSTPLRLPFPFIALEFRERLTGARGSTDARRVVFCIEDAEHIIVWSYAWLPENGTWATKPQMLIQRSGYIDRSDPKNVHFFAVPIKRDATRDQCSSDDVMTMLSLCNALACSNVKTERSEPKKAGKKVKAALPFDSYHILTIDSQGQCGTGSHTGSSRAPREHLRRGHIRRLADSRKIWVNATIVAAGRGAGVVTKAYAVK